MMPVGTTKDRKAAIQIILFSFLLIPISFLPWYFGYSHMVSTSFLVVFSGLFTWQSVKLYKSLDNKDARKLMFYSIMYLPVMFLILLIDKMVS